MHTGRNGCGRPLDGLWGVDGGGKAWIVGGGHGEERLHQNEGYLLSPSLEVVSLAMRIRVSWRVWWLSLRCGRGGLSPSQVPLAHTWRGRTGARKSDRTHSVSGRHRRLLHSVARGACWYARKLVFPECSLVMTGRNWKGPCSNRSRGWEWRSTGQGAFLGLLLFNCYDGLNFLTDVVKERCTRCR